MIKFILRIFVVCVLAAGIAVGVLCYNFISAGPLSENKVVLVKKGSSFGTIANNLQEKGVIDSAFVFRIAGRLMDVSSQVKVGEYEFVPGMSVRDVMNKIISGEAVIHRFSVPEGYTSAEIVKMLNAIDILSGDMITYAEEGTLLPETYYYSYGDSRQDILARMQRAMRKEIDRLWDNRYPNLPIKTKEEAIILASIVEKETGIQEERDVVASVFTNRLRKNMRLQSDPTVIYAFKLERKLYKKDLETKHPYNTYRVGGLPPGPICNPGIESIKSVLNPAQTSYLYFVADGTGGHVFASDYDTHRRNVNKWREINKSSSN